MGCTNRGRIGFAFAIYKNPKSPKLSPWLTMPLHGVKGCNREIFQEGKVTFPDFSRCDFSFFWQKFQFWQTPKKKCPLLLSVILPVSPYISHFPTSLFHFFQFVLIFLLPFSIFPHFLLHFPFFTFFPCHMFPDQSPKISRWKISGGTLPTHPTPAVTPLMEWYRRSGFSGVYLQQHTSIEQIN